jgi:Putative auto-transporter adhesin, head GIN domain
MRNRFLNIIGALLWVSLGCNKPSAPDCLQTAGSDGEISGALQPFSQLEINDNIDYVLHIDTAWHYQVMGPFNLLSDISFHSSNNQLQIKNDNTCNLFRNKKRRITVHLYAPQFHHIDVFSQGKLTCMDTIKSSVEIFYNNANCNSTWLFHNDSCNIEYPKGTGDITVIGQSTWGWIYSNALGKINGKNWICQNLSVHHNSLQNLYAHPVQYLHAEIHNQGNLYIPFYPITWDKSETAEGKLIIQP